MLTHFSLSFLHVLTQYKDQQPSKLECYGMKSYGGIKAKFLLGLKNIMSYKGQGAETSPLDFED